MNDAEIRKIIEASPLAMHVDAIMKLAVPAVKMNTYLVEEGDLPLGASRMGGAPDLPPGSVWPENKGRPAEFLVQIDFAAVAEAFRLPDFPVNGWIVLFRDLEASYDDDGEFRVLHFDCAPQLLTRWEYPGEPAEIFNFCEAAFEPELCLPNDIAARFAGGDEEAEEEAFEYFDHTLWDMSNGPFHRLGGPPMLIQSDDGDYAGLQLLMQIDSDDEVGWMWGDMGRIYCWGRRKGWLGQLLARLRPAAPLDRHFSGIFADDEFY